MTPYRVVQGGLITMARNAESNGVDAAMEMILQEGFEGSQLLGEDLTAWRRRALGACPYVVLDARYEKVRHGCLVIDCAVLVALGMRADGKRDILGVSVALSEAEVDLFLP